MQRNELNGVSVLGEPGAACQLRVEWAEPPATGSPFPGNLARRARMTAHMAILKENEAIIVAKHSPLDGPRTATWIGKRMDVHCTGLGKALIAYLTEPELEILLREHGLPRHNENTISLRRSFVKS